MVLTNCREILVPLDFVNIFQVNITTSRRLPLMTGIIPVIPAVVAI